MNKRQLGTDYEDIACDYLQKAGYVILDRNFRSKKGEIDIIAKEKNVIVFVEVKFRQSNSYGYSAEAVNYKKQMIIYRVAEAYLAYKKEFYNAPVEDISQSVGIGDYEKYVIQDGDVLMLEKQCPVSVQGIARFNHLAHKNGEDNKRVVSGKIKYYNIRTSMDKRATTGYFGFPAGELPSWAPPIAMDIQWEKTIIDPINRFLEVMNLPLVNSAGVMQMSLFGF